MVSAPGASVAVHAYVSVLSADGSSAMPGASRWLDERASGTTMAQASIAATASSSLRIASPPSGSLGGPAPEGAGLPSVVLFATPSGSDHSQDFDRPNVHLLTCR